MGDALDVKSAVACPSCGSNIPAAARTCPFCHRPRPGISAASHWTSSPWTGVIAAMISVVALLGALAFPVLRWMTSRVAGSSAYKNALENVASSPAAQRALGSSIHETSRPFGTTTEQYGSQFAQWRGTLSGSLGSGEFYGVA